MLKYHLLLVLPFHKLNSFREVLSPIKNQSILYDCPAITLNTIPSPPINLINYDYIIFGSPFAVNIFFQQYPSINVPLLSVGPSVSAAIKQHNHTVYYEAHTHSLESLIQEFSAINTLSTNRFLLPCSNANKLKLPYQIDKYPIYDSCILPPSSNTIKTIDSFKTHKHNSYICITSPMCVQSLYQTCTKYNIQLSQPLLCLGPQTLNKSKSLFPNNKSLINKQSKYNYQGMLERLYEE